MSRISMLVAVAMLSLSSQAFGQGEVVSFYGFVANDDVIGTVPQGGFVLTDFTLGTPNGVSVPISLRADTGQGPSLAPIRVTVLPVSPKFEFSFRSGVKFEEGSDIVVTHGSGFNLRITLTGYIPAGSGTVPAVSTWGLIVMAVLMLSAGTLVMTRRKPVVV